MLARLGLTNVRRIPVQPRYHTVIPKTILLPHQPPRLLSEYLNIKEIGEQDISHVVYYATNKLNDEKHFLKDIITDQRRRVVSPEEARFLSEKEVLAGRIALSIQGEGHVPITGLVIGEKNGISRYYVYSREIEHYTSLKTIKDHLFDEDNLFYVNKDGHTCVTLNEKPRAGIPVSGRIESTIVRRFVGEGDPNNKNAGVIINGPNRGNIVNIDYDSCFQSLTLETAEQLAFGIPNNIIPGFNMNHDLIKTITRRQEVKENAYRKIASIDPKELSQYLKDGFSESSKFHFKDTVQDIHDGMMETHEKYRKTYSLIIKISRETSVSR